MNPKAVANATLELTPDERAQLLARGYVHINDTERGDIKVWMRFNKKSGLKRKQLRVQVIRGGKAAMVTRRGHY